MEEEASWKDDVRNKTKRPRYPKLRGVTRELADKYVAEEVRTGKYSREQAVAVGISRARAAVKQNRLDAQICDIMRRYR